jgi:phospho-N-acetylmuramoyl-pentapeptide-transferase
LGAAMGYGALVTRNEILLLLIGGVFVMELVSVVLQIGYFRYTGGKRLFRCAPIHHHFHLAGWSEPQVVVRFWLLAAVFAATSLFLLAYYAVGLMVSASSARLMIRRGWNVWLS